MTASSVLGDFLALLGGAALPAAGLFLACWVATSSYERRNTPRLLAAMVWTVAGLVVVELVLGTAGALAAGPLKVVTWSLAAVVAVAGAGVALRRDLGWRTVLPRRPRRPTAVGLLLGVVTLGAYAWLLFVGTLVPPTGWDTLTYHLTDVFHFAGSGSVSLVPQPGYPFYYPKVAELISTYAYLLASPPAEAWRVTGLALVPFALIAGVATRAAGEALELRHGLPWLVPGVMLMPIVLAQPLEGNIDVAFTGFLLASFAFSLLAAAEGRFYHLAHAALAAGLALGSKLLMLFFGPALLLVLAAPRAWRSLRETGKRRWARLLLLVLLPALGCGFWLGRAFFATGNPFYPQSVSIGSFDLFSGPVGMGPTGQEWWFVPRRIEWLRYPFYETMFGTNRYGSGSGFGPQFAAGLVATLVAIPVAIRRRRWLLLRALLVLPATILLWYLMTHSREPRYAIACGGYALVGLAALAEWIGSGWAGEGPDRESAPAGRGALFVVHLAVVVALIFGAAGGMAAAMPQLDEVVERWRQGTWEPEEIYRLEYGPAGDAFNWLAELDRPVTLSPTRTTFIAPVYGWHGENRVVFATLPDDTVLEMTQAPVVDTWRDWYRFLRRREVDLVVTWSHWWEEEPELNEAEIWIREHPEHFERVADFAGRMQVFRFSPGSRLGDDEPGPSAVEDLGVPGEWELEYSTGTETTLTAAAEGGLRLAADWQTEDNDWCDWRTRFPAEDWSAAEALDLAVTAEPQPALLFLYLKTPRAAEGARFRIDLTDWSGTTRLRLPLHDPDWSTRGFSLERIAELHLVLDDMPDESTAAAEVVVSDPSLDLGGGD